MDQTSLQPQTPLNSHIWEIAAVDPFAPTALVQPAMMPEVANDIPPSPSVGTTETIATTTLSDSTVLESDGIAPDPTQLMTDFFGSADWLSSIPSEYVQLSLTAFIANRFAAGDFSFLPTIRVVPAATLGSESTTFDALTGSLYLSDRFLADHASQPFAIAQAMLGLLLERPQTAPDLTLSTVDYSVLTSTLDVAYNNAQLHLQLLFSQPDWLDQVAIAFGDTFDREKASQLASAFLSGELSLQDIAQVVPADALQGAIAVYDNNTGIILLSDVLVNTENIDPEAIASILLEEFGHYIDAQVNSEDTQGDEGEIFSAIAAGIPLTPEELDEMRAEDDRGLLVIDGQLHLVEV